MKLLDEIKAKCSPELIASRDVQAIVDAVNVGRTRVIKKLGGIGLVLETLGPTDGAVLLDALYAQVPTVSALKWAWKLLERGELDYGSSATRQMIDSLVPGSDKEALLAVAEVPDPVTYNMVENAIGEA